MIGQKVVDAIQGKYEVLKSELDERGASDMGRH